MVTLDALRALVLPHTSAHAREVLSRPWVAAMQAIAIRDGAPLGQRTRAEACADTAVAYTMAAVLYPASAEKYARWAAGWAALVVGEDAVRSAGGDPAPREEIEG